MLLLLLLILFLTWNVFGKPSVGISWKTCRQKLIWLCPLLVAGPQGVFSGGGFSGTVSRGDFLLSLNGASLAGLAHGDVLKALHQAQLHKDVLMVIKKGSDQPRPSSRQEPPTANGKGLVSRKTSPLEPGTGKKSVQQLQWPELFVMVLARTALIPLNKKLFLSRCLRSVGRVRSLPSAPLSCSYSSRKPKPFPVPANTLLIRSCHA